MKARDRQSGHARRSARLFAQLDRGTFDAYVAVCATSDDVRSLLAL